ncbi:hypothetical protein HDA32_004724 [Spinactinospora alkalitolerans]|uniref:Uncharacterized protein n=1 Tax=Spinactinospora alkalitolerans TaxID=687207 RepID=A0A852U6A6_9ACTN|nr:DUF3307 domain-containing protein [Spinactinospora alkalitolerans]NYE49604.1 hypothetical protein [Spinactinospora alkalitolerans]
MAFDLAPILPTVEPTLFAPVFVALFAAHQVGDHWVQSSCQAATKARPGWAGRAACARHVASLALTKVIALAVVALVLGLDIHPAAVGLALAVDAGSHYWADRRTTLARLAQRVGKGEFYTLGAPRPGHDDAPHLGTGAYALDQSWHVAWLLVAALITTIGGA